MAKRLKYRLVFGVLALIVLIGALLASLPWLVSTDLVRSAVEREMSDFAGRPVMLNGNVDLSLFPAPFVTLDNVSIPSRDDADTAILTIDKVVADIAPLTLLSRNPNFTKFKLERPRLNLTRDAAGTVNWRDAFGRIGTAVAAAKRSISESAGTDSTEAPSKRQLLSADFQKRMGQITFENGSIYITAPDTSAVEEITALSGNIEWLQLDGMLGSSVSAIWRGQPFELTISAQHPLAILAGDVTEASIQLTSDAASLTYDGTLGLYDGMFADGNISISTPSMPALLDWLKAEIAPGRAINSMSLSGPVKIANHKARFEPAAISLGENSGSGVLEVGINADMPPSISGTLDFESLDLALFLRGFVAPPSDILTSNEQLELNFISQLRADLRLSAQSAQLGDVQMTNLAATAQINETSAIFDIGDAETYGGNLQGRLQFSSDDDAKKTMQISASAQNINTSLVADGIGLPSTVPVGNATITLNATTRLSSWRRMAHGANGDITMRMEDGVTQGFGVSALLTNDSKNQFFTVASEENSDEPFNSFAFEGALADGVMTIREALITYETGTVKLEGVAPYRSGGIALTATAVPMDGASEADARRFFIGGSWDRAFATPLLPGSPNVE